MTRSSQVTSVDQVLDEWAAAWTSRDVDRVLSLFTDDVVYEDVPTDTISRGKDEFRAFVTGFFAATAPDGLFRWESKIADANRVAIEFTLTSAERDSTIRCVSILELDGGRIRRATDYWDLATVLRRAGQLAEELVPHWGQAPTPPG
jgi:steroid delta-isomerase-like uncharacterized protein